MSSLAHRIAVTLDGWAAEAAEYAEAAEVEAETGEVNAKAYETYEDAKLEFAEAAEVLLTEARPILGALEWLFESWDRHTLNDIGPHLTCGEAEAMVDLLRAAGRTGQADSLLSGHADGDEEGDEHHRVAALEAGAS